MRTFKQIAGVVQLGFSLAILASGAYGFIRNNYRFPSHALEYAIGDASLVLNALTAYWLLKLLKSESQHEEIHIRDRFF
jgi:hypothetical protein